MQNKYLKYCFVVLTKFVDILDPSQSCWLNVKRTCYNKLNFRKLAIELQLKKVHYFCFSVSKNSPHNCKHIV